MQDREDLYADRSWTDKEFVMRSFLWITKNTNMEVSWKLKFIFCFMETIHVLLHLDKWSWYSKRPQTYLQVPTEHYFIWQSV
jgi:hypothetical protein